MVFGLENMLFCVLFLAFPYNEDVVQMLLLGKGMRMFCRILGTDG